MKGKQNKEIIRNMKKGKGIENMKKKNKKKEWNKERKIELKVINKEEKEEK